MPLSSRKPDHLIWGFGPSDFLVSWPFYPVGGRHFLIGRLLCSSLHGQNFQHALTIPGGIALVAEPMVRTTPHKADKADTSSAEVPMTRALVALPGSKALDDNPDHLDFTAVKFGISYWMSSLLQRYRTNSGKLDCPGWHSRWSGFCTP
jgi:hypothetical protein